MTSKFKVTLSVNSFLGTSSRTAQLRIYDPTILEGATAVVYSGSIEKGLKITGTNKAPTRGSGPEPIYVVSHDPKAGARVIRIPCTCIGVLLDTQRTRAKHALPIPYIDAAKGRLVIPPFDLAQVPSYPLKNKAPPEPVQLALPAPAPRVAAPIDEVYAPITLGIAEAAQLNIYFFSRFNHVEKRWIAGFSDSDCARDIGINVAVVENFREALYPSAKIDPELLQLRKDFDIVNEMISEIGARLYTLERK